jgi:hypothetical protein
MKLFHGMQLPRMIVQKILVMSFQLYAKCHWCGTCVYSAYTYIALKCIAIPAEEEPYLMNLGYHLWVNWQWHPHPTSHTPALAIIATPPPQTVWHENLISVHR